MELVEQDDFQKLKQVNCSQSVLKLPYFSKPFEIHKNASHVAYGEVLIQDGHS